MVERNKPVQLFSQQIFTEYLCCARHCSGTSWVISVNKAGVYKISALYSLMGGDRQ